MVRQSRVDGEEGLGATWGVVRREATLTEAERTEVRRGGLKQNVMVRGGVEQYRAGVGRGRVGFCRKRQIRARRSRKEWRGGVGWSGKNRVGQSKGSRMRRKGA